MLQSAVSADEAFLNLDWLQPTGRRWAPTSGHLGAAGTIAVTRSAQGTTPSGRWRSSHRAGCGGRSTSASASGWLR